MKHYLYNYQTIIRFSSPVSRHCFRLRCMPCENSCQKLTKRALFLRPSDCVTHDTDTWGNPIQYGNRMDLHDNFVFVSVGEADLASYRLPDREPSPCFSLPSKLTASTESMKQIAHAFSQQSALDQALALSTWVYHHMRYQPGITHLRTTATEALELGQGVCQDYAHILLALCRAAHIPARYVNGFMEGEGATHAWVEIYDQAAWWGIDPTNNRQIEWGYIKLSHGRDAEDCPVNRGVFTGTAIQTAEIRVTVEEI